MIVWLASYPRSGNTFTRVILNNIFNVKTHTVMGSSWDEEFVDKSDILEIIGGVDDPIMGEELINKARESNELYVLKTHFLPIADDPAVYIVRDGRASTVSYFHYINEIIKTEKTLEQVIKGDVIFGDWSSHIDSWSPDTRSNTLLIKFENLTANPQLEIDRIGNFLNIKPLRSYSISTLRKIGQFLGLYSVEPDPFSFSNLQSKYPAFFRTGENTKNLDDLQASGLMNLFWEKHRTMMARYGYETD